jgi:copper homeostasis protein
MKEKYLLEVSVETLEGAMAAERGGADRIELCGQLSAGGITPSAEAMMGTRANVAIPVFAMIRPRAGDFVYSDEEFTAMRLSIKLGRQFQMDGVVLGILTAENRVDVKRTRELVELARGLEATFHRAIDETADLPAALEDVVRTGATRILTSGGKRTALEGAGVIAEMVSRSRGRVTILPGAGISAENAAEVLRRTGASEIHSGLSSALPYASRDYVKFEEEVRKLANQLRAVHRSAPKLRKDAACCAPTKKR